MPIWDTDQGCQTPAWPEGVERLPFRRSFDPGAHKHIPVPGSFLPPGWTLLVNDADSRPVRLCHCWLPPFMSTICSVRFKSDTETPRRCAARAWARDACRLGTANADETRFSSPTDNRPQFRTAFTWPCSSSGACREIQHPVFRPWFHSARPPGSSC